MILTNKDENKTKTYFHPQIIKDDKYQQSSGWYGKVIMRTPYYFMNDDNEKHFVLNLASDTGKKNDDENERKELAKYLFQLRKNNGGYITFYSRFTKLSDFFEWVRKHKYTLEIHHGRLLEFSNPSHVDFCGNIVEYAAAFRYRIYTREVLKYVIDQLRTVKRQPIGKY